MPGISATPSSADAASRTACPTAVLEKVRQFAEHIETYKSGDYSEAQLRIDFLNPLLEALGWDVENKKGYAEAYRDVVYEDAVKIGGASKAPDYGFYIGGRASGTGRKFFLEAKKPAVNLRVDPAPAYQLRRYAWTAKLPLSILTDFEEFIVYDTRLEPLKTDKASTAAILTIHYEEFQQRWHEIADLFSIEAIRRGSFDRFAQSMKKKRGAAPVDEAFLKEIEGWRDELAKNIAKLNADISQRDLNFAVQRTIDRIIFLRMCEDRGIEPTGNLMPLLSGDKVYERLSQIFRRADERYNSGLFHFAREKDRHEAPDELTLSLSIDDKVLKGILKRLYDSPYEFAVMPPEILGQVYEQFLGKVITLTSRSGGGHRAKVEEKPEVRKAGGVYYTPAYIVDYIVKNTVGRLLGDMSPLAPGSAGGSNGGGSTDATRTPHAHPPAEPGAKGVTPKHAAKLRVLDPACGSGSFLIGAYQYLLDWHLRWYLANNPEEHCKGKNPALMRVTRKTAGDFRLTTAKRKEILLNSVYGVDIDPQAVEVTKLSLLLKVLEGESQESINAQLRLFHARALPDLGNNIKCGNSLIGPDFYENQQLQLNEEDRIRINVFDWHAEFPDIFKAPGRGFDAVIGNPPYVRMEEFKPVKEYLRARYKAHEERADLYAYFLERGIGLLHQRGVFGMIVSNKFIKAKYGRPLRSLIAEHAKVQQIVDLAGADVFHGATVRTVILIIRPYKFSEAVTTIYSPVPPPDNVRMFEQLRATLGEFVQSQSHALPVGSLSADEWVTHSSSHSQLIDRMRSAGTRLEQFLKATALFGLKTGLNDAFIIDRQERDALVKADSRSAEALFPVLFGRDIRRYATENAERFVIYLHPDRDVNAFRSIRKHLEKFRKDLESRAGSQAWYELQQPAVGLLQYQSKSKIVYPIIANECRFTLESDGFLINDKAFILPTDDLALLGILNSKISNFYFAAVCAALEGKADRYLEFRAQYVDRFPVPKLDKAKHGRMVELVERMLELHKKLAGAKSPADKERLPREIAATDKQIDQLVYELYGLSEEEIHIVERS